MRLRTVSEKQLGVLRWIASGCPEDGSVGQSFKTSAIALRNRGLANVSKRGGWHASLTEAGRYYLEHGAYPEEPHPPRSRPRRPAGAGTRQAAMQHGRLQNEVAEVQVPVSPDPKKPARRIAVPQRLAKPHPVIVAARDEDGIPVSKILSARALRIAHALALAFEKEGWAVLPRSKARDRWNRSWSARAFFVVDTGEYRQGVYIGEENDRTDHVLTAYERKQEERYSYSYAPKFDYSPSGRLFIEIETWHRGRRQRWADRQRWQIEEKLGQIVDEIEARALLERDERLERERKEVERQARIQAAVQEASLRLRESHRREVFLQQVEQWHSTNRIREFLAAMATEVAALPEDDGRQMAQEWMQWCQACTASLDPLKGEIRFPEDPAPTEEALRPFLPDWMRRSYTNW